eukprot:TRINITY_DN113734_c0_g1_i1.p1 TRINITY_DN113734_c0_g1~~TRINITY_DN113734_c0_g1_i1.p1  ORF type:complete len:125 (+),score=31.33 TRINITY_DN113734_c0_g1_i1:1-375(+)
MAIMKSAHEPVVQRLIAEVDSKLLVTEGGTLPARLRLQLEDASEDGFGNALTVVVPSRRGYTVGDARRLAEASLLGRCGPASLQLGLGTGSAFQKLEDADTLAGRRYFMVKGVDWDLVDDLDAS